LHRARGDLIAAHRVIDEYVLVPEGGREDLGHLYTCARAAVSNADGNWKRGLELAETSLRATISIDPVTARLALIEAVEAGLALDDRPKALELIHFFREHVPSGRQPSMDAHIHRWSARLAVERTDGDEAGAEFRRAIDAFATLKRSFWVAVTRLEMAELQRNHADVVGIKQLLAQARQTFAALRATPWIERVDVVTAALSSAES
jgi:hypothetical protein